MSRLLAAAVASLVIAAPVYAQTPPATSSDVPAILGASAAAVNRQIAAANENLARQAKLADQAIAEATRARDASLATSGSLAAAEPHAAKPVPAAPTEDDVRRAERRLARLRSQVHAEEVTDAGVVTAPNASRSRARIVFPYLDSSIYEIYAAPDRMTSIELQPGEHLTTENGRPKAADTVQWVSDTVTAGEGPEKRTIILVKPILTGIETNMLIPTNRRVYHLLLRADSQAYMPLVGFNYPFDDAKAHEAVEAAKAQEEAAKERVAVLPEQLAFRYSVRGSRVAWRPLRVFDDGQKTYIEMSKDMTAGEAPALFVMESGSPSLVNYRVKGNFYIVDRLFDHAQLRISRKAVDIYRDKT
jgi:type IV secretion system protein TrbG